MRSPPAAPGDAVADVDTPALLLDLDAFEANIARLHDEVLPTGVAIRPHGKAHKCPEIGRRQVAAGAVGVCAQTLGEAEIFVRAGIGDVLLSNEIAGTDKAARLAAIAGTRGSRSASTTRSRSRSWRRRRRPRARRSAC